MVSVTMGFEHPPKYIDDGMSGAGEVRFQPVLFEEQLEDAMKTVQEYLREADRNRLLDTVAYDTICDTLLLLEYPDRTIAEIQDAIKKRMDDLIDKYLQIL